MPNYEMIKKISKDKLYNRQEFDNERKVKRVYISRILWFKFYNFFVFIYKKIECENTNS